MSSNGNSFEAINTIKYAPTTAIQNQDMMTASSFYLMEGNAITEKEPEPVKLTTQTALPTSQSLSNRNSQPQSPQVLVHNSDPMESPITNNQTPKSILSPKSKERERKEKEKKEKEREKKEKEKKIKYERVLKSEIKQKEKQASKKLKKENESKTKIPVPPPPQPMSHQNASVMESIQFETVKIKSTPHSTGINYGESTEFNQPIHTVQPILSKTIQESSKSITPQNLISPVPAPRLSKTKSPSEHVSTQNGVESNDNDDDNVWDLIAQHRNAIPKSKPQAYKPKAASSSNTASLMEKPKTLRELQKHSREQNGSASASEKLAIRRSNSESDTEA